MKLAVRFFCGVFLAASIAFGAQAQSPLSTLGAGQGAVAASGGCAESNAFIARTAGLDAAHVTNYHDLICGLVTDTVWAELGVLYVFATQDSTNALLNLVSASNNATITGLPLFTTDQGFTGLVVASNHISGPAQNAVTNYLRDDAHLSCWMYAGKSENRGCIQDNSIQRVLPNNGGVAAARINESAGLASGSTANSGRGHYLGTRSASNSYDLYVNGAFVDNDATASVGLNTGVYQIPQSTATIGPVSIVSMGGNLSSGQITSLYNRFATYMTATGQPVVP